MYLRLPDHRRPMGIVAFQPGPTPFCNGYARLSRSMSAPYVTSISILETYCSASAFLPNAHERSRRQPGSIKAASLRGAADTAPAAPLSLRRPARRTPCLQGPRDSIRSAQLISHAGRMHAPRCVLVLMVRLVRNCVEKDRVTPGGR